MARHLPTTHSITVKLAHREIISTIDYSCEESSTVSIFIYAAKTMERLVPVLVAVDFSGLAAGLNFSFTHDATTRKFLNIILSRKIIDPTRDIVSATSDGANFMLKFGRQNLFILS